MLILSIDTSGKLASAALLRDGVLLAQLQRDSMLDHSRTLLPMCRELLESSHLRFADVDLFAAVTGPGSFTGVRIGTAAVKGFAWSLNQPCVGISSLLAAAWNHPTSEVVCTAIRARQGEYFYGIFQRSDGQVIRLTPDRVSTDAEMQADLAAHACTCLVEDGQSAAGAAFAAQACAQQGLLSDCHSINPAYLRITQAERTRMERLKKEGTIQ